MKKFVIGIFILGVLVVYSVGIRHEQPKIGAPNSLATNNTPNTTTSGAGSPPTNNSNPSSSPNSSYKDGTYTGNVADAYYGNVQVQARSMAANSQMSNSCNTRTHTQLRYTSTNKLFHTCNRKRLKHSPPTSI